MTKISLEVKIIVSVVDTHTTILAQVDNRTIARRRLFGVYSQEQAEREWRLNKRYFQFESGEYVAGVRKLLGV